MSKAQKKLVLIDGSSYLFRAFHALPPLMTADGTPTGAAYGVINMIRKLLKDEKPDYVAVVFDTKSKTVRHDIYPEYKAHRPDMAQELSVQIKPLHEIIEAMGLPLLILEGFEADDIIATLAAQASKKHIKTVISTGDKDLTQLVDDNTTLINTMSGTVLDIKGVIQKFGVKPEQMVDYLALIGDPVDNIPGIPKVGPKTAVKWLEQFESLDGVIKHADEITGKVGDNLRQHLENLPLGKKLVTVDRNVPLDYSVTSLQMNPADNEKLKGLFQKLEFKTWLRELGEEAKAPVAKGKYHIICEKAQFQKMLDKLSSATEFVIRVQTSDINPLRSQLIGLSFAVKPGEAFYVPLAHDYADCPAQLDRDGVLEQLKPILENKKIGKMGQNIKYDLHVLSRYGINLENIADDTMLESYVLNSVAIRHAIDSLAKKYLEYDKILYEDVVGKGAKQVSFGHISVEKAGEFAAEDADVAYQLHHALSERINKESSLQSVYREIEMPLIPVLWRMERTGVRIDSEKLTKQSKEIAKKLKELEKAAFEEAGESFNLGSPKQLQEIFYEKLKLPVLAKTPKGAPSTSESVLQELSLKYELPKIIVEHRGLSKLKSTYTDKLPEQVNPDTGRVHTSYHQAVTATGRLSSTDPNLQNIPIRNEEGRKIRQAFIPSDGYVMVSADYSQIELRIMAHLSKDEGLLKAFSDGQDIHTFTASQVLGIPIEKITPLQRRSAKAVNFGLIYGMSAFGLAQQLDIERSEAQEYINGYFNRYPKVKKYMDGARQTAAEQGYVETLFGRRVYLPDIHAPKISKKRAAERAAINGPMQGTAADIIKKAMITLDHELKDQNDIRMLMQVHDELVFEVKPAMLNKAKKLIQDCMQNAVKLSTPIEVSIGVGDNWDMAH